MFFLKKSLKVTGQDMLLVTTLQNILQVIHERKVQLMDCSAVCAKYGAMEYADGSRRLEAKFSGRYLPPGDTFRSLLKGSLFVIVTADNTLQLDHAVEHLIKPGQHQYRAQTRPCGEILVKPAGAEHWRSSQDLLKLDELPFEKVSCSGVQAALYSLRIRTLGHLCVWSEKDLHKATGDIAIVNGTKKVLAAVGRELRPE